MPERFALIVLSALLLAGAQSMAAQGQPLGRPVAIDKLPAGSLYVLDGQAAVHAVDFQGARPAVTGSFRFPSGWAPSDIVSAQKDGKNILFLSVNRGLNGQVWMCSTTGQTLKFWSFQNGVAGIDYDLPSSTLFVASGRTPEVFRINLAKDTAPEFVGETTGSQRLGPVLYDAKDSAVLVGDVVMGAVYKVEIAHRKSSVLFSGLKSPAAMKLSGDGSSLFVADAGARSVVRFSMAQPGSAPVTFAAIPQFRSPSGLAWVGDRLAVSDDGAQALFILSRSGRLDSSVP